MDENVVKIQGFCNKVLANLEKVIVGKKHVLEQVIVGLICQGHILIEDVPGVGKTIMARALSKSIGCSFNRLQFTPDMLPSDVTGVSIFNQVSREFEFRPGPVMAQILLGDEINRATPKTQSALLEAMEERQVTVDGVTYPLPKPFMVMATQNPIEYEGTFPLPEAQLDRFLMRIRLGYPQLTDEIHILELQQIRHPIEGIGIVASVEDLLAVQESAKYIYVSPAIKRYIVELVRATREHQDVYLGASPRGSLGLFRAGQVRAAIMGRDFVLPDDIKYLAPLILGHRIVVQPASRLRNLTPDQIVAEVLGYLPVPSVEISKK
ncbi:MAG TPA: MoxR family ATPase [Anaerolineaceae bacterium]|jgi:MoxR-like ATPase|nr:MoxR family ATPase [Anaerolineaceae bacterium]HOH19520.1 MoxR family ATPase [Anaerolineaceae bacterium]HQF44660.1 MoxR family ATPase [Anaerolineaceae bacterium]HQH34472.1 MoxR family ATPase [Anaerolineaceae bacterium]